MAKNLNVNFKNFTNLSFRVEGNLINDTSYVTSSIVTTGTINSVSTGLVTTGQNIPSAEKTEER